MEREGPSGGQVRVWDAPVRLFHWFLVAAVALALLSSGEDSALNRWHVLSGWVAAILVVFRIAWGFAGGEHSRFGDFLRPHELARHVRGILKGQAEPTLGHNPLGALSVLLLLALVAATVGTGALRLEESHELIAWSLLGLVAIHVAAVFTMSLLTGENLMRAMVTGSKPRARHPGARDARRPGWKGMVLTMLVVAGAVYAVRAYDPLAFTLRSAESYEHGGGVGRPDAERDADDD